MKTKHTPVPPGWRKLRTGEKPRMSDRVDVANEFMRIGHWLDAEMPVRRGECFIRRLPGKAKK